MWLLSGPGGFVGGEGLGSFFRQGKKACDFGPHMGLKWQCRVKVLGQTNQWLFLTIFLATSFY